MQRTLFLNSHLLCYFEHNYIWNNQKKWLDFPSVVKHTLYTHLLIYPMKHILNLQLYKEGTPSS